MYRHNSPTTDSPFSRTALILRRLAALSNYLLILPILVTLLILGGCNSARLVDPGSLLLDKVNISVDSTASHYRLDTQAMEAYLTQTPNHKMLWSMKFRLGIYNLSGRDTTKFWNRWVRKLGEAPVIYDSALTATSAEQLRKMLVNKGYLKAHVVVDSVVDSSGKKISLNYKLSPGGAYTISELHSEFEDDSVAAIVRDMESHLPGQPGSPLDRESLESRREAITRELRNRGYFGFTKENITFSADTTYGSTNTELTMMVSSRPTQAAATSLPEFGVWKVGRVVVVTDYNPAEDINLRTISRPDSVMIQGLTILYGDSHYLRPQTIAENCFFRPGDIYRDKDSDRTYQALQRLQILKFINIRTIPTFGPDMSLVDVYILLTPGKSMTASLEVEGTNSEGDLGVAVGLTFTHRNIGKGSETLSAKVQGSYEAISGHLDDLLHNRYLEYAADVSLTFPKFKAPFLSESFRRKIYASSALNISMNYQDRPEYTRVITTAGWSYKWNRRDMSWRQTFTPIDVNYVYLPRTTYDFIDRIAPDNPLLRYSYEDHFIMRMAYNFYLTNRRQRAPWEKGRENSFFTIRGNIETAGNLLFGLSNLFSPGKNFAETPYSLFGIRYSQYVKMEGDFSYLHMIDSHNSVAFHVGAGIGIPYANSSILPFEKRFYGGGANGVRGWAVRTLGPGSYPGINSVSDFINQCGDIRLLLNAEYRAKLFWVLELGAFVDVGNIWTIRDYENQPGGVFRFDDFLTQLAAAYGLGLRMDFSYFLLRFDLGMKAHNPARGQRNWPLFHPRWSRDASFHFSIGYPF